MILNKEVALLALPITAFGQLLTKPGTQQEVMMGKQQTLHLNLYF